MQKKNIDKWFCMDGIGTQPLNNQTEKWTKLPMILTDWRYLTFTNTISFTNSNRHKVMWLSLAPPQKKKMKNGNKCYNHHNKSTIQFFAKQVKIDIICFTVLWNNDIFFR